MKLSPEPGALTARTGPHERPPTRARGLSGPRARRGASRRERAGVGPSAPLALETCGGRKEGSRYRIGLTYFLFYHVINKLI